MDKRETPKEIIKIEVSVPLAQAYRAACTAYLRCVAAALARSLRVRAKRELALRSVREAQVGMVMFVQRADSALQG